MATTAAELPEISEDRRAMMLFTSGTTNKPKGVVSTHKTIKAQITTLIEAWEWSREDVIPLFLPLHHIHGIVNILSCGLWAGATVHLFAKFDIPRITEQVASGTYNVFMAVPTIYVKLIQYFDSIEQDLVRSSCDGFNAMRLNISGSAACPVKLFNQWQELTGQVLLERYGMTEIGMGISNPYAGERRAGCVTSHCPVYRCSCLTRMTHQLQPRKRPVKSGYRAIMYSWNTGTIPKRRGVIQETAGFCTGDVAVLEDDYYRIMGRSSVDIIKSGGYKLSALEIEGVLLTHEAMLKLRYRRCRRHLGRSRDRFRRAQTGLSLDYEQLKTGVKENVLTKSPKH